MVISVLPRGTAQIQEWVPTNNGIYSVHITTKVYFNTHVKQPLAILYPKILEIMPVGAYNASIILHTPIMLKIMLPMKELFESDIESD